MCKMLFTTSFFDGDVRTHVYDILLVRQETWEAFQGLLRNLIRAMRHLTSFKVIPKKFGNVVCSYFSDNGPSILPSNISTMQLRERFSASHNQLPMVKITVEKTHLIP